MGIHDSQKLSDAATSLKAVRKYQKDRRTYGSARVKLYFDDTDGNWFDEFASDELNEVENLSLSKSLCKV